MGVAEERWTLRVAVRVMLRHAFWQPTGLIVLPIASMVTVPFAWCFGFYQNLLVADPNREAEAGVFRDNWRLARMWHEQSWAVITLVTLVSFLVWVNCLTLLFSVPYLLKTLLGVETLFSRVGAGVLNSTTMFSCVMLSYVITDPLVKAGSIYSATTTVTRARRARILGCVCAD